MNQNQQLPGANRNSKPGGSVLESIGFTTDDAQPHPGELLFRIENTRDLVMKADIPESMVPIISRMLWKAERYNIPALLQLVEWYLITGLASNRQGREEYINIVVGEKKKEMDEDLLGKT